MQEISEKVHITCSPTEMQKSIGNRKVKFIISNTMNKIEENQNIFNNQFNTKKWQYQEWKNRAV